jgi:hypothetical protein
VAGNLCAAGWGREQDARAVGSENVKDRVQGRGLAKPGPPVITASRPPGDAVSVVLAGRMRYGSAGEVVPAWVEEILASTSTSRFASLTATSPKRQA